MIKSKDYKYVNNPDYSLAGERFYKNALDFLLSNSVVNAVYLSSNEQLDKYIPIIDVANKKLATVGSSGDQILNALYYGCKDITFIDANVLSEAYIEYKIALIKTLSFEEFKNVAFKSVNMFDWRIYSKISHNLKGATRQFFDEIFMLHEGAEYGTSEYYYAVNSLNTFMGLVNNLPHTEFSEFYHSQSAYLRLQEILRKNDYNIEYNVSRLEDFPERLSKKYDVILLSNIYDYVNRFKFNSVLKKLYENKLNEGGVIQFQYYFEDSPFKKKPRKYEKKYMVKVINLPKKPATKVSEKDRDKCQVYLLKKPNSKELELG